MRYRDDAGARHRGSVRRSWLAQNHAKLDSVCTLRILLTNDDGIDARGLAVAEKAARAITDDVWIVAPLHEQSGKHRSVSILDPIRIRRFGERRFAVQGTPTDCVIVAFQKLLADKAPDLVLSGINRGPNIGDDVLYSGTTAAAVEGALNGARAIAWSQGITGIDVLHWDCSEALAETILRRALATSWPADTYLNVNFPDVAPEAVRGVRAVPPGGRWNTLMTLIDGTDGRGVPYHWLKLTLDPIDFPPGTDMGELAQGYVTLSPIQFRRCPPDALAALAEAFDREPLAK